MNSSNGRVGALVNPSVDPLSGEPEFKSMPVRVEPFMVSWYGCLLSRSEPCLREMSWWACAQSGAFRSYEVAGRSVPLRWPAWARTALLAAAADADFIDYEDASAGTYRAALLHEERLEAYVCVTRSPEKSARSWLATLFAQTRLAPAERAALLAARPAAPGADVGPIVCACFGIGRKSIEAAIEQGAREPGIGRLLKAGTNCGSCLPELRHLIARTEPA